LKRELLAADGPAHSGKTNNGAQTARDAQQESRDQDGHIILLGTAIR
jgi:hypothetical protein